jgi:ElaB/YqjD/DUF883 family membrane-anchored ribosome-binding protein
MDTFPFRTVDHGFDREDVVGMLAAQMELARTDPRRALELLSMVELRLSEPGVDADEVEAWVEAQRTWLTTQVPETTPCGASGRFANAVSSVSDAIATLQEALEEELQRFERRMEDVLAESARVHEEQLLAAQRRMDEKLDRARRKTRKDAQRIREEAIDDAQRILEQAGLEAARRLIDADTQRREASSAAASARELQEELLGSIDAARAIVTTRESTDVMSP